MRKNLENILSTKTRWLNTKASRKPCFKKMPQVYLRTFPKKVWLPMMDSFQKHHRIYHCFFARGPPEDRVSRPGARDLEAFTLQFEKVFVEIPRPPSGPVNSAGLMFLGWGIVYGCFILPPTTVHKFLVSLEPRSLSFGEPCPIASAGDGFSWPRCLMGLGSFVRLTIN